MLPLKKKAWNQILKIRYLTMRRFKLSLSILFFYGLVSLTSCGGPECNKGVSSDLIQAVDQARIGEIFDPRSCADTCNPEATVNALFEFAVAVGVLPAFFERVLRYGVHFGAGAEETSGG